MRAERANFMEVRRGSSLNHVGRLSDHLQLKAAFRLSSLRALVHTAPVSGCEISSIDPAQAYLQTLYGEAQACIALLPEHLRLKAAFRW